ncbi:uncharacterized protein A4U43_C02F6870 [Asparagus officinalis]|uniref:Uncharacterized protein n=1 Tax=Asparagus officinalis TaxID=4686 RepID=A0A5P1FH95_ASPOF|nr:serine/arginine repetitive matrix protein 2-like [Asparagus officinalis]ONK77472.1 uncharacterized protein A4U43_C02F6870 [Asparagus officinalis]
MKSTASPPESAPPPTPRPRLRSTRSNSSTSFSFSSSSSSSSIFSKPSPSRQNYILSPSRSSSSSIPFSWEQTPGIPKTVPKTLKPHPNPTNPNLPLPPPLRSDSFTRNIAAAAAADPFAVALVECRQRSTRGGVPSMDLRTGPPRSKRGGGPPAIVSVLGSCKTSCLVANSVIEIRGLAAGRILWGRGIGGSGKDRGIRFRVQMRFEISTQISLW